jgi:3-oxoadipate enol-lactonase
LRKDIFKIETPTLFIAGLYDPITTIEDTEFMMRSVPGSAYVSLPASHLSNIEKPEAFNQAVLDFLEC